MPPGYSIGSINLVVTHAHAKDGRADSDLSYSRALLVVFGRVMMLCAGTVVENSECLPARLVAKTMQDYDLDENIVILPFSSCSVARWWGSGLFPLLSHVRIKKGGSDLLDSQQTKRTLNLRLPGTSSRGADTSRKASA
jgi:hypothetical protein